MALKHYIPARIRAAKRRSNDFYKRLQELDVEASGCGDDGVAWVEIEGLRFHSYLPDDVLRAFYNHYLNEKQKENLCEDAIGAALDYLRRFLGPEDPEQLLNSGKYLEIRNGDQVIEAGAFTGIHAMRLAQLVGTEGKVLAIEAVPENFRILEKNIRYNELKQVITVNKAVWDEAGTIRFHRDKDQLGSIVEGVVAANEVLEITSDTLEQIARAYGIEKLRYARIQLNGAEPQAVAGMGALHEHNPVLMVAGMYDQNGHKVQEVLNNQLVQLGYQCQLCGDSILAKREGR